MITRKISRFSREELLSNIAIAAEENNRLRESLNLSSFGALQKLKNTKDIAKYQHWLDSCEDKELYIFNDEVINKDMPKCMKF